MPQHKIDETDIKILAALQENGRLSNVDLSELVGLSAAPCLRRLRTLEETGFIRKFEAKVDPGMLGFNVTAFLYVGLASQAASDLRAFEESTRMWPTVRECFALSGEIDFLLKCVAKDLTALQAFVIGKLMKSHLVKTVKSSIVIREIKDDSGVPLSQVEGRTASPTRKVKQLPWPYQHGRIAD